MVRHNARKPSCFDATDFAQLRTSLQKDHFARDEVCIAFLRDIME